MALNMSAALNITANVQGAQAVSNLNTQLQQLGQQGQLSARQIRQAYMQLPAQLQDVAVSLAGGQNPFMVLLQQGSQLATQFGGVGGAIRGVLSIITPARIAFTGLAGAVAAFATAAFQGYQEGIQLQRQLAITGNFAGMTADSFERAAARIQAATGATALAAREMLMGAAGSGAFGPASIDAVTQAMTRLQLLTGQSSEEIVKLFAGMRNGAANWAAETNKSYNFLTVEQYKYIRLLEEQGQQEAAMKAAADALNGSLSGRTVELGYLERAWKGVKEGASGAWNAMMNIGRPDSSDDQIKALESRLFIAQEMRERYRRNGLNVPETSPQLEALKAELAALREAAKLNDNAAQAAANRARANQEAIAAERKAEEERRKAQSEAQSREQQRLSVLQGLRDEVLKLAKGEDELTLARMRGLNASPGEIKEAERLLVQRRANIANKEASEIVKGLRDEINKLRYSEEELVVARLRAVNASPEIIAQARLEVQELERRREEQKKNKDATKAQEDSERALARQQEERRQILEGLEQQILSLTMGEDELTLSKLRGLGADAEAIQAATNRLSVLKQLREEQKMQAEAKSIFEATRTPAEKLNSELSRLNKLLNQGVIDWDTYSRAVFKAQDEFDNVGKKGKDTMSELKQAVEGWGRKATDTFIDFAFTGKASFKDLVNSILQDIARMIIQKQVMGPLMQAVGGFFGFADGGVMTSSGPLPLKAYSNGGIANSPQVAVFGEGRMPEAYVPLPDGRSIPVTMQGGSGGDTNVVVNVNMESGQTQQQGDSQRGVDLGAVIAGVVKQELINQRRPGGLLAAA